MESLAVIAEAAIQQTGFFFADTNETTHQTGIIRTNCVDCLDRTNTAQFALGRCALAYQLHKMGFLMSPPKLEFDSDCVTMLESLYEIHGDTLALQYGGSQLVHRIKTYRKTAAWTSTGSDFMQNLSRYYSNTFSDQEKQQSINLFLGHFIPYEPREEGENLWDITNDYQLHNPIDNSESIEKNITMWFSDIIRKNLPHSTSIANKIVKELIRIHTQELEMTDLYANYHLTYQLTSLEENIAYQISQFARNFMPTHRTNFSPFEPCKRNASNAMVQSSIASTNSSNSSSDESDSSTDEDDTTLSLSMKSSITELRQTLKTPKVKATCQELYGFELHAPDKDSMSKYKSYVNIQKKSQPHIEKNDKKPKAIVLESLAIYNDSYEKVTEPIVEDETVQKYQNYCNLMINKNYTGKNTSLALIEKYVNFTQ